jgi:HEAT repeat protein
VLLSRLLQRDEGWRFDIQSALIGAILAWIIAGIIYSQREKIKALALQVWEPIAAWRRRIRASREEKYVRALKEKLTPRLLLSPEHPDLIFHPPEALTAAPLPTTLAEAAQSARMVTVPYATLLDGHSKLIVTGQQGVGRTTAMVMSAWQSATQGPDENGETVHRLPIWIDLNHLSELPEAEEAAPAERLVALAARFAPFISSKWLLQKLRRSPCLVLVDNWADLSNDDQHLVAGWIAEASPEFQDTFWMITGDEEGYGRLVEVGFVPLELLPAAANAFVPQLYANWAELLGREAAEPEEEVLEAITGAADAGAPLWELHLRTVLHLRTGELPDRPVEVCASFIEDRVAAVDLGRAEEEVGEQARDFALLTLIHFAKTRRLDGRELDDQEIREFLETLLPPKEERHRRLEPSVRKVLLESGFIEAHGKTWGLSHRIWIDYLTATHLAEEESGHEMVSSHLNDPDWLMLSEFFAGLTDTTRMVKTLIDTSREERDKMSLLRAARWAIVAEPDLAWRKTMIKILAQVFIGDQLDTPMRMTIGRALGLVAGKDARAFFLRVLRHPSREVRSAALRGLGWAKSPGDMAILAAALREKDALIQESGVRALRDLGTPGAVTFLSETLPKVDEALMLIIAEALAAIPGGGDALDTHTRHPDLLVRRAAAHGLGLIGEDWSQERLLEIAREDDEWLVRSAAENALQAREEREGERVTISPPPQVDQMEWLIAWAARQGEGLGIDEAAVETLIRAASEGNADAKVLSALTLAQIGRKSHLPVLQTMIGAGDPMVHEAAEWAIERIQRRYRTRQT